jgi:hypothetical protein
MILKRKSRGVLLRLEAHPKWQDTYISSLIKVMGRRNFTLLYAAALRSEQRLRHESGQDYLDMLLEQARTRVELALGGTKK